MPERRKNKRKHLYDFFDVLEQSTGKLFGQLVDITIEGLKIMSTQNVTPDTIFDLKLILPPQMKAENVLFSAQCVWNRGPNADNYYDTGFKITKISDQDMAVIRRVF